MDIFQGENVFYIGNLDSPLAKLEFEKNDNHIGVTGIYVVSHLKGQGLANSLIKALLDYCRENNLSFTPTYLLTNNI